MSLEHWDSGSTPPAQWVKDMALPQLRSSSQLQCRSERWPWELHMLWDGQKKKKKKGYIVQIP